MNSNKVFVNLIWRFMERCGSQIVALVVSVALARVIAPEAYGTIALVTVFTAVLQVFVDSGLGNALIQKKNADDLDFSSVFFCNIAVCVILYLVMFIAAPFIAKFYDMPDLTPVVRVLSLTLVISGVKNVQQAYVSKNMLFKRFFFATIGGTVGAAVVGVAMAYMGFGVWALVVQQLFNLSVGTIILWFSVDWRPKLMFSFERLKGLFSYGSKLLAVSLINNVYNNIRQLIIGKMYSSVDLAFYNRGKQFPDILMTNINTSIDSVLLPAMSQEQDKREHVKAMTRRAIKVSSYILSPLMIGFAAVAEPFTRLILTEKWLPAVSFMRIFCIAYLLQPIHTANLNAMKAMGRSDLFLKIDILKIIIGCVLLIITMQISVLAIASSFLISGVIGLIINIKPNIKLLGYSYAEQIRDILPSIFIALLMGGIIFPISFLPIHDIFILCLQVIVGAIVYIAVSYMTKNESFLYIWSTLHRMIRKR